MYFLINENCIIVPCVNLDYGFFTFFDSQIYVFSVLCLFWAYFWGHKDEFARKSVDRLSLFIAHFFDIIPVKIFLREGGGRYKRMKKIAENAGCFLNQE